MKNRKSVTRTFELAIEIERKQGRFYRQLVGKFAHVPQIAEFWQSLEQDEIKHEDLLRQIQGALDEPRLISTVDPQIYQTARNVIDMPLDRRVASLRTLNDAYELAHELENDEFNTVFDFLIRELPSKQTRDIAAREIERHLQRLIDFPTTHGDVEWRKGIMAGE